jgi:spermidine/putrescine transport system substrate-binding protein
MSADRPEGELRLLAPRATKRYLDGVADSVQRLSDQRLSRGEALGLGGLALLGAACGGSTNASGGGHSSTVSTNGKIENSLVIYNWSDYDEPKTYSSFRKEHPGLNLSETYFASNDELLAKLQAGGGGYDIVVPTQNAVKVLIDQGNLMALNKSLLPNYKGMDPAWTNLSYDPGGKYSIVKDYGVTLFFYKNDVITEQPKTWLDFYNLLPKYGKVGRTNLMEGAEEVVPIALMALGLDPNTGRKSDFDAARKLLLRVRKGVTTIQSSDYIAPASAGKIILGQGWSGDIRRILSARKKQGDITAVLPVGNSERWADNWCILATAKHPIAAHAWLNHLMDPKIALGEMLYHNYPIPIPKAIAMAPPALRSDPLFNIKPHIVNNYTFILNPSPKIVNQRTQVYTEFKAA